jgi:hypothetical protein
MLAAGITLPECYHGQTESGIALVYVTVLATVELRVTAYTVRVPSLKPSDFSSPTSSSRSVEFMNHRGQKRGRCNILVTSTGTGFMSEATDRANGLISQLPSMLSLPAMTGHGAASSNASEQAEGRTVTGSMENAFTL